MSTVINGTDGIDKVKDGTIVQADLAANVVGNGPIVIADLSSNMSVPVANADYTIIFNQERDDSHAAYNPANGIFTAPVAGYYQVNAYVQFDTNSGNAALQLWKNGANIKYMGYLNNSGGILSGAIYASAIIKLAASDTLALIINTGTTAGNSLVGSAGGLNTNMSICLIRSA